MAQKITLSELRSLVISTMNESSQDSKAVRKWWNSLSPSKQQELVEKHLPNNEFGALAVDDNDLEIMYAKENPLKAEIHSLVRQVISEGDTVSTSSGEVVTHYDFNEDSLDSNLTVTYSDGTEETFHCDWSDTDGLPELDYHASSEGSGTGTMYFYNDDRSKVAHVKTFYDGNPDDFKTEFLELEDIRIVK